MKKCNNNRCKPDIKGLQRLFAFAEQKKYSNVMLHRYEQNLTFCPWWRHNVIL